MDSVPEFVLRLWNAFGAGLRSSPGAVHVVIAVLVFLEAVEEWNPLLAFALKVGAAGALVTVAFTLDSIGCRVGFIVPLIAAIGVFGIYVARPSRLGSTPEDRIGARMKSTIVPFALIALSWLATTRICLAP